MHNILQMAARNEGYLEGDLLDFVLDFVDISDDEDDDEEDDEIEIEEVCLYMFISAISRQCQV